MYENYNDVLDQLRSYGLLVSDLQVNSSSPVRCSVDSSICPVDKAKTKTAGWYHLADFVKDQKYYIIGAFGYWKGADNNRVKVELGEYVKLTAEQKKEQHARMRKMQLAAKKQRNEEIEQSARRAQFIWSKYSPTGTSDYLDKKGVKAHGIRFGPQNTIAVPMTDERGKIYGLQLIRQYSVVKNTKKIQKKFEPKGLGMRGNFHLIGTPREVCLIAEGYATATTIHETTGLPVAVSFNANNLKPVAIKLKAAYPNTTIVVCADDDYLTKGNPGIKCAEDAINQVGGRIAVPDFKNQDGNDIRNGKKLTDFNDLAMHPEGGLHLVREQINALLKDLIITTTPKPAGETAREGGREKNRPNARSVMMIEEIVERFLYVDDDAGETCFDHWTKRLVKLKKVQSLLPSKTKWDEIKSHPTWVGNAVYIDQVGFDPTEKDPDIKCNMWGGWPMESKEGDCSKALGLLEYLCGGEDNHNDVFSWLIKWLAYPLQHPGAKMQSAIVMHGNQGTGKSMVFEAVAKIYGEYGIILNQGAIEDKFNSDWTSKKLFVIADEVVANSEKHHLKNQLKGLITGDTIRVNPKNLAAYIEKNQMNLVFLSNEKQPVVIENDDRRHCVIWTPPKMEEEIYHSVKEEIENGGIQALYHHLLQLDLGDFKPWTQPPMTKSKQQLIEINRDTVDAFINDWLSDGLGYPVGPVMCSDLYGAYQTWCYQNGEKFPRSSKVFNAHIDKLPGWFRGYKDRYANMNYEGDRKRARIIIPSDQDILKAEMNGINIHRKTAEKNMAHYITDAVVNFEFVRAST